MPTLPTHDFEAACRAVLAFLHQRLGFGLWMVTRTEGDDWIVLQAEDHGYGVAPGTVLRWADSFCLEMVRGHGPRVAPDAQAVPAYRDAPINLQIPIQAYVGVPLVQADGSLFGTLCGIDPARQPAALAQEQSLIELLGTLLSSVLQAELRLAQEARRSERLALEANTDAQTQLANRRAWDEHLAREEDRCRRYGHPAAVLVIDLDGLKQVNDSAGHAAGDALIAQAALALRKAARESDIVARLGGDEFGILAVECDPAGAQALLERTRQILAEHLVPASVGLASRTPGSGLPGAWKSADARMYAAKSP
ncbi:sensor domain-containing diguanylate cyclase [Simplicispira lacusdiani]|uniref:sensor domain-containing diguanylate cyclase n=1 Tax=Simplicispira lacusdiani TaxID=2213010 RepID=UPI000E74430C|nr:sensor domain-containing diguanylate cyclase [Simplicispira lacusdiani]